MAFRGFPRRLQRNGGWLERVAIGTAGTAPVYPPLYIKPTAAPSGAKQAGDMYVDANGVLQVHNGTSFTAGGGANVIVAMRDTDAVDGHVFIADRAYQLVSVENIYPVAAGGALTLDIKKCTGTTAPASGTTMLAATINLNTTVNTTQTPALSATPANLLLADGDKIARDYTGSIGSLAGSVTILVLRPV